MLESFRNSSVAFSAASFHLRKKTLWLTRSARESKNIPIHHYFSYLFPSTKLALSLIGHSVPKVPSLGKAITSFR